MVTKKSYYHEPVMLQEVIEHLNPRPQQNFVDCTVGGGGHARAILERTGPEGKLLGIDLDESAVKHARKNLKEYGSRVVIKHDNYKNIKKIVHDTKFYKIGGILCDLGLSSAQLEDRDRGFGFKVLGELDARFNTGEGFPASVVVNTWPGRDLAKIFQEYADERLAKPLAEEIVRARKRGEVTAKELVDICRAVYQRHFRSRSKRHPATKVWQALRIAVNSELDNLRFFLPESVDLLPAGARIAVITYHSIEDRIVKEFFKRESRECLCPQDLPVCCCGHKRQLRIITKKPVKPTQEEVRKNPRSRSAHLRVAEKI